MKPLLHLLQELARPEVTEFAIVSDRLPCVKQGDQYRPVDDAAVPTDAILQMLVAVGGSRYVDDLEGRPAAWTTRVDGLGAVAVLAASRGGRVQARFTLTRKEAPAPRPPPQEARADAALEVASDPMLRAAVVRPGGAPPVPPTVTTQPSVQLAVEPPSRPRGQAVHVAMAGSAAAIDAMLAAARDAGASDLHVVACRPVLLRVAGELAPRGAPVGESAAEEILTSLVPERLRATLDEHGSCDFALERPPHGRFRVNVSRQRTGLKGCFRCIPPEVPTLASLGLPPEIERATHHHQGLVLVTGPTGHGKTSTLAALVDVVNRDTTRHVITVEDPVEYVHARKRAMVSQREVGTHTRSFASALKASLREDPDVIVVGELRDVETVRMALAASETGHLVLGTMNTPSAAKTIDRLIDLFPPADQQQVRMTLAGGLHLVVSQRLVPTADGKGMAAAVELLPGSVALWTLIRDNKTFQIPSLQQRGKGFGILRLDESLTELVRAGRVEREAAVAVAENPDAVGKRGG